MKLDLTKMRFKEKNLFLPKKIDEQLAEEIGLHIGDGTMNFYKNKNSIMGSYALRGHRFDDRSHYDNVISKLYKEVYDLTPRLRDMPSTSVYGFQKWSNELVDFKNRVIGLPLGKKLNIEIPNLFLANKDYYVIFDTDGMIYLEPKYSKLYPRVEICTISKPLADKMFFLINKLSIRATNYSYERNEKNCHTVHKISVRGNEMLDKWMKIINPHNPKHWDKYQYFINNS